MSADAPTRRRRPLQLFRVASLALPSAAAWQIASTAVHRTQLDDAVAHTLGPLWLATTGGLLVRGVDLRVRRGVPWLDAFDVLTASGASMAWTGAAAILGAVWLGWASLSVVGLFGLGTLHMVALWTLLRARGADPWRRASLERRFVPAAALEGDALTEELHLAAPRIPAGFRLFASGRVGPRWPISRYVVSDTDCGGDVVLQSDVGPALRGTYDAEPFDVWLEDVLGLCHSPRVRAGATRLVVLPRPAVLSDARPLLFLGGPSGEPRAAVRLPTDGCFRLREYQPGDDVRRIHWVRSLTARQIVVRLPDELPLDRPAVRLVLDTFHPRLVSSRLSCTAPDDLLDALVRVWLSVGQALVDRGVRVTLVAALGTDGDLRSASSPMHRGAFALAAGLGARVGWQGAVPPSQQLTGAPSVVVSHRLPATDVESAARWVAVPGVVWAVQPAPAARRVGCLLAHPPGSADNRRSRRRLERERLTREHVDGVAFRVLTAYSQARSAGNVLARPAGPGQIRLELLP